MVWACLSCQIVNSHWRHDPFSQERFVQELMNVPLQAAGGPSLLGNSLLCKNKWRTPCLFSCSCWTLPPCVKSAVGLSRSLLELSGDNVLSSCHSHICDNLLSVSSSLNASEEEEVVRRAWVTPWPFCVVWMAAGELPVPSLLSRFHFVPLRYGNLECCLRTSSAAVTFVKN